MKNGLQAIVIGSGFAGLSSACCLAQEGWSVKVLEKNTSTGGRARSFSSNGFKFDMGPSWYWMPDVFESFFNRFGKSTSDYYDLKRLDPSYKVYFGEGDIVDLPASIDEMYALFESIESGSSVQLKKFLREAEYKYEVGIKDLVYKPGNSLLEFADLRLLRGVLKLDVFKSFHKYVRKHFSHPKLIQLLEFPVLFLGAMPKETPALYSLMNYADISLGTWYPDGGMNKIVEGMESLARSLGVEFELGTEVTSLSVEGGFVSHVIAGDKKFEADVVIGGADYHHIEHKLLPPQYRKYDESYWEKRTMAPSSLIFYLGVDKRLNGLDHHNLFFDSEFERHAQEIYINPKWPTDPLFYVCCPSQTDQSVAPEGKENLFVLIPVAPGLEDTEEMREKYFEMVLSRLESLTGQEIRSHVVFKRSYAHRDFKQDYHAFKGNAYGLANTLMQTAILKPSIRNAKVNNLYYTGQLTVPGPGVPPSIISGQVVASEIEKDVKKLKVSA